MDKMSAFEFWQVVNMTIQSVLLLAAFLGALYVGLKQYEINEQLVELQHQPSVEVAATEEQLQIFNKGNHNLWLWGTQIESESKSIEREPRLITTAGPLLHIPGQTKNTRPSNCWETGRDKIKLEDLHFNNRRSKIHRQKHTSF